ncbi:hypothetical protein EDD16DRAFT_1893047 [Pisolithus croceorrhizus]|nr:hypothetical protein EV401DRAFT_2212703 [Pisolithus croceorrhizus]KAI6126369.1 hypothetical protein EDD16DRAFT_1893047 [Pisolithus croceorrhizus]
MAAIGKLYTLPGIKATAAVAGVEPEEPIYKHYEDDEMPELLAKFPCGRIPTFEGTNGFNLTEGAAIARYKFDVDKQWYSDATVLVAEIMQASGAYRQPLVASVAPNSGLPGDTVEGTALIDQYVRFAETEYKCPFSSSIYCKTDISLITRPFTQHLLRVNPEVILLTRAYLVDERLTLADIAVASVILLSVSHILDTPLRNRYPDVLRHLDLIIDQPKLKDVFGQPTFVEKAMQYTPPTKEKKEKEPKQPAPASAPNKEKPKKAEEDDEEDENPSLKTPLISYQNRHSVSRTGNALIPARIRTALVAHECFCEKGAVGFMSSNQISGFFNRLEVSRKYLFGSVGITRAANDSIIAGVVILWVKMSKPVVEIASNYESYDYKKLGMENSEDKAFFDGALTWDLEIDNEKWQDGKNFK